MSPFKFKIGDIYYTKLVDIVYFCILEKNKDNIIMKKLLLICMMSALSLSHTFADNQTKVFITENTQTRSSVFSGGTGSEEDPYLISTSDDLVQLSDDVQNFVMYEGKYFKMTNDIDMSTVENFRPIGNNLSSNDVKVFCGTFDGNGYTVRGMNISYEGVNNIAVGMFGVTMQATIKNLNLDDCTFKADALVAPLVAVAMGTTIKNCHVGSNVKSVAAVQFFASGLVAGAMGMPCIIEDCSTAAAVDAKTHGAAGILGACSEGGNGTIVRRCVNYGSVHAFESVAGIVAICEYSPLTIEDCANYGDISSESGASGIMYLHVPNQADVITIHNCINAGSINVVNEVNTDAICFGSVDGGLSKFDIDNCFYADDLSLVSSITSEPMNSEDMKTDDFVNKLNNGRTDGPWNFMEGVANGFPVPHKNVYASIQHVTNSSVSVDYSSGMITVDGLKNGENITISDMSGRIVKIVTMQAAGSMNINVESLPSGVYVINTSTVSKKIVK